MKTRITLICTLALLTQSMFCQVSNVIEGSKWKEVRCNYWTSQWLQLYHVDNWRIDGDTILAGTQYKKVYNLQQDFKYGIIDGLPEDSLVSSTEYFFGGIREEDQKVYIYSNDFWYQDPTVITEKLMFDYSASVGDTLTIWCRFYYLDYIVEDIVPEVMLDGSTRDKFILGVTGPGMVNLNFIEGIGSNYGIIGSYIATTNDQMQHLLCFSISDESLIENNPVYTSNCLFDPIQELCESSTVGVEDATATKTSVSIYPNPTSNILSVVLENQYPQSLTFKLFSSTGQALMSGKGKGNSLSIDLFSLPVGLYYLEIMTDGFEKIVKKVVKQD